MSEETWNYSPEGTLSVRPVGVPSRKEALDSFIKLDTVARTRKYAARSTAVSGCPKPYLDVHVHDVEGTRLRDVPVTLDFPEGGGQSKNTDREGLAHFPDVDVDASTLMVQVHRDWPDDQPEPTYRATVVPKAEESTEENVEATSEAEEPMLYFQPWRPLGEDDDELIDDDAPEPFPTVTL